MRSSPNPVASHLSDPGCKLQIPQLSRRICCICFQNVGAVKGTIQSDINLKYNPFFFFSSNLILLRPLTAMSIIPETLSVCLLLMYMKFHSKWLQKHGAGGSHGLRQWFSTWLINSWFCNPSDSQSGIFRQPRLNSGGVSCLTAGFWTRDLGD